ncbi:hypothetical protein AB0J89_29135 [Micromonospora chokoriensis]
MGVVRPTARCGLQTRVGKRTLAAAFVIAAQLVDEGRISLDEALQRVSGDAGRLIGRYGRK